LYDSIGLPPNINYAVINIKNEKGTTNGKPSTKLICKQNIHNMLIVIVEITLSKSLDKARTRACFILVASHSTTVATKGNMIACA
jgi:hypothetical protein